MDDNILGVYNKHTPSPFYPTTKQAGAYNNVTNDTVRLWADGGPLFAVSMEGA